jgi:hypothetical protein
MSLAIRLRQRIGVAPRLRSGADGRVVEVLRDSQASRRRSPGASARSPACGGAVADNRTTLRCPLPPPHPLAKLAALHHDPTAAVAVAELRQCGVVVKRVPLGTCSPYYLAPPVGLFFWGISLDGIEPNPSPLTGPPLPC